MVAKSNKYDWRERILKAAQRRFEAEVLRTVVADLKAEKAKFRKSLQGLKGEDAAVRKAMIHAEIERITRVEERVRELKEGARFNFERQLGGAGFKLPKLGPSKR
jgi:hypothetical protein